MREMRFWKVIIPLTKYQAVEHYRNQDTFGEELLEVLLVEGVDLIAVLQAYLDESGTHQGSNFLCVAGYLFDRDGGQQFARRWAERLRLDKLNFFHAVDCAHGVKQFSRMGLDRHALYKDLIEIVRDTALQGVAVSTSPRSYERLATAAYIAEFGDAYSCCLQGCLAMIGEWADRRKYHGAVLSGESCANGR